MHSKFSNLFPRRIQIVRWSASELHRLGMALLLLAAVSGLSGCTHVSPWKRGALADPVMQADRDPLGGMLTEHMWFSREAATGGRGVGGGGCGCN